jgi:hypothetical protein
MKPDIHIRACWKSQTDKEMAAALGLSVRAVAQRRTAMKLMRNRAGVKEWTRPEEAVLYAGVAAGQTYAEMHAQLPDRTLGSVRGRCSWLGLALNKHRDVSRSWK